MRCSLIGNSRYYKHSVLRFLLKMKQPTQNTVAVSEVDSDYNIPRLFLPPLSDDICNSHIPT